MVNFLELAGMTLGVTIGAAILALYWFQDNLLYFPQIFNSRTVFDDPQRYNLTHEEVFLRTPDNLRIQCWWFKSTVNDAPTLLYFHGNAGNISHRLIRIASFRKHFACNVLIVAYRGYGRSEGSPNEAGLKIDAETALEFLLAQENVKPDRLLIYGESLGGAVAIALAAKRPQAVRALILENTFTSIADMMKVVFPAISMLSFLSHNRYESATVIPKIDKPILFLSGSQDELVPPRMMRELYEAAPNKQKYLRLFPNGQHNTTWQAEGYYAAFIAFLKELGLYRTERT